MMAVGAGEVITRSFDKEKVALAALGAWVGTTAACVICSIITFFAARLPRGRGVGSMTMGAGADAFLGAAALAGAAGFLTGTAALTTGLALDGAGAAGFFGATTVLGAVTFLAAGLAATLATGFAAGLAAGLVAGLGAGFLALEVLVTAAFAAGRAGFLDAGATADEDRPLPAGAAGFFLAVVVAGAFTKDLLSVPDTA